MTSASVRAGNWPWCASWPTLHICERNQSRLNHSSFVFVDFNLPSKPRGVYKTSEEGKENMFSIPWLTHPTSRFYHQTSQPRLKVQIRCFPSFKSVAINIDSPSKSCGYSESRIFQIQTSEQAKKLKGNFFVLLYNWKHPFLPLISAPLSSWIPHVHSPLILTQVPLASIKQPLSMSSLSFIYQSVSKKKYKTSTY